MEVPCLHLITSSGSILFSPPVNYFAVGEWRCHTRKQESTVKVKKNGADHCSLPAVHAALIIVIHSAVSSSRIRALQGIRHRENIAVAAGDSTQLPRAGMYST
jgi:hypothetical protein